MNNYVALLRGINVSGQKKVNMKELKTLFETLDLSSVSTYIQSGNVVFRSANNSMNELKAQIEHAITQRFSFDVPVQVIAENDFKNALNQLPFDNLSIQEDGSKTLFSFLSENVNEEWEKQNIPSYLSDTETLVQNDSIVYLHCPNGYGKTKITNNLLERKLNVTATTRNWKTVVKLIEMLNEIE